MLPRSLSLSLSISIYTYIFQCISSIQSAKEQFHSSQSSNFLKANLNDDDESYDEKQDVGKDKRMIVPVRNGSIVPLSGVGLSVITNF